MSQLMFWNKQNNNKQEKEKDKDTSNITNGTTNDTKNGKRNWLHSPDALLNGHVVYLVKFFGNLPVDQPKGIEVVKDVIRKLQFAQQMRKADTGTQEKFKKLEITISVDGVAIQEPRTQKILHQFPLHNISYCADEKGVKKFFSFIAKSVKQTDSNGNGSTNSSTNGFGSNLSSSGSTNGSMNSEETHECFVFISNKLASDITLTIGQAFELAYRKYMNSAEKTDLGKAQQQIAELEKTVDIYKNRLRELSAKIPKSDLDNLLFKLGIKDICDIPPTDNGSNSLTNGISSSMNEGKLLIDTSSTTSSTKSSSNASAFVPTVPPRNNLSSQILHKSNSQKMDELLLNPDSDSDFDPRAEESLDSSGGSSTGKNISNDLFGFEPSKSYGQQLFFTSNNSSNNSNSNNNNIDSKFLINNNNNTNSFTNDMLSTPPLLAPPPKVSAPRRTISNTSTNSNNNNNNILSNGTTDLFGSDPFDINAPSLFKPKQTLNIDDFSLESLDPLRK